MLFERFSKDADWLQAMGVNVDDPAAFDKAGVRMHRAKLLSSRGGARSCFGSRRRCTRIPTRT